MPNWCENDLTVTGPTPRVREFQEFARSKEGGEHMPIDFERFVSYPKEWDELDRARDAWFNDPNRQGEMPPDGYNAGGYDWCIQHWGTKWNAHRGELGGEYEYEGTLTVTLHFSTAWSPPRPIILKASELFPELEFDLRYFERGAAFNGMCVCKGGTVTLDETGPYFGNRGG